MEKYIRTCLTTFTAKEMQRYLQNAGVKANVREIEAYLHSHRNVFALKENRFVTRAATYTDELFSIKPTRSEVEQGMFVVGSRCAPFADPDMVSCAMDFYVEDRLLTKKVGTFDSDLAIDMFILFGEEYATQYIANDPAVTSLHLEERNFELPAKVPLTGVDLNYLKEHYGFEYGDRLLCCVSDWDDGIVKLMVLKEAGNDFNLGTVGRMKLQWYETLEEHLLESFRQYGPGSSVEDQFNYVFSRHVNTLCNSMAGSVEEYIESHMRKVSFEFFGVETRLWFKGETVPAIGQWNNQKINTIAVRTLSDLMSKQYGVADDILRHYVADMCFRRDPSAEHAMERIYPKEYSLQPVEKTAKMLKIVELHAIFSKTYNWFRDQEIGPVRKQILILFTRVSYLVYRVDCNAGSLGRFPQKEVVVLSQLYGHLVHMLGSLESGEYGDSDAGVLLDSVEGMSWNFEDIRGTIENTLASLEKNRFKVIRTQ